MKNKGQIPFLGIIATGFFTIFASVGGAWMSGSASAEREIGAVNLKVELVQRTEELHYKELKEDNVEVKRLLNILIDNK